MIGDSMKDGVLQRIAFIGFGEVGGIFAAALSSKGQDVVVYDTLLDGSMKKTVLEKAKSAKVRIAEGVEQAVAGTQLIISATTASSALPVAIQTASYLSRGQVYLDINSVSPNTKKRIGEVIDGSGADFVEAAVMAAVKPTGLKTPILLGGSRAFELAAELRELGMDTTAASDQLGVASAIKMCRSIVMKGMAALAIESLFAARLYGAEEAVLASFEATYPSMGWSGKLPDQLVQRSVEHSRRRAAELREVAETLLDAGMTPRMALAAAELQDWLTEEMDAGHYVFRSGAPFSWTAVADAMMRRQ
jgi:3-hydroxyisobutyrate dehydrogenase-like beta-hydroxyacid dehydrogenase